MGAGAGAYEPTDREVVALEPSEVMIAQRPPGAAPVVRGRAEELPFEDGSFDAVMAVLSDHHWSDRRRGFAELRRVARDRVVLFNANPAEADLFWLTTEYLPEFLDADPGAIPAARSMGGGAPGRARRGRACPGTDPARLHGRLLRSVLAPTRGLP